MLSANSRRSPIHHMLLAASRQHSGQSQNTSSDPRTDHLAADSFRLSGLGLRNPLLYRQHRRLDTAVNRVHIHLSLPPIGRYVFSKEDLSSLLCVDRFSSLGLSWTWCPPDKASGQEGSVRRRRC